MSVFGIGDIELLVIAGLALFFFGRGKLLEWYRDFLHMKHEAAKIKEEVEAEATLSAKTKKAAA